MGTGPRKRGEADENFARNLGTVRAARRLTLRQVADRLKQTDTPLIYTGLHGIEQGRRSCSLSEAVNIARALDLSLLEMLSGSLRVTVGIESADGST